MASDWSGWRLRGLASRTTVTVSVLLIGVLMLAGMLVRSAAATTITVNSVLDTQADDGECTLREAIIAANTNTASGVNMGECDAGQAAPTVDLISFSIPGPGPHVISAATLPSVTERVEIDGYTEPGSLANTQASLANGTDAVIQIQIDGGGVGATGLQFDDGSDGSTVKGIAITGYTSEGVLVQVDADGVTIQGNFIGVDAPAGGAADPNGDGIALLARATVGGTSATHRNLISGNDGVGIYVVDGDGTLIQGNLIGTDPAASAAEANGDVGLYVDVDVTNLTIGTGTLGNVISGNDADGIEIDSADTVTIRGNRIGTNGAGTAALGNGASGISMASATNVTVGGASAGEGNLISGNDATGVEVSGGNDTIMQGNIIGLNLAGTAGIPNGAVGVTLFGTDGAIVGGSAGGARNVISGNDLDGIVVFTFPGVTSPVIQGNRIGTSADGLTAIANGFTGISVNGFGGGTLIGGTGAGEGNLISGNDAPGIDLLDGLGATIQGNIIGLNANETAALPNGVGGIFTCACVGPLLIGGTAANAGNVISGNIADGIYLDSVTGATIQNNRIGTNSAGSSFGNQGDGIRLEFGSANNTIGGTGSNEANVIANNFGVGVNVLDASSIGNTIRGNSIRANGLLGIDLDDDNVTANDATDADSGPNELQNFPALTSALAVGGSTEVAGSLTSTASSTFAIDVYASSSCDPLGNGEGNVYLGSASVSTNGAGLATFDQSFAAAPGGSPIITATATNDSTGSTSEFSVCRTLDIATPTLTLTPTITQTPTVTSTPTVTPTGTLPATSTPTPTPSPTSTPTPTPTPTLPSLEPSGGDDKGAPAGSNRNREKEKDQQRTEEQRQQDERTNQYGQDQYRVEGNVTEVRTVDGEPAIILANRDGDVVVILRCGDSCPTVKVGDYVIAEGEKEHEQLFYADSVSIEN